MDERIAALEQRLAAVERRLDEPGQAALSPTWVVDGAQRDLAGSEASGTVVYGGVWDSPVHGPLQWQFGQVADALLARDWDEHAASLAALGSPIRLEILRQVLNGVTATSDLGRIEGLGTSGQLHHHLRILVAAGWLQHRSRGDYAVPGPRVIPLLAILVAAITP